MTTIRRTLLFAAALVFSHTASTHAASESLDAYKGKYTVAIRMTANGVSYAGSGTATFRAASQGRKGVLKFDGVVNGGQGTAFPMKTQLTLKAAKSAKFDDLTLAFTASAATPGSGKYSAHRGRLKFKVASNATGLSLSGLVTPSSKKGRAGKVILTSAINNAALLLPTPYNIAAKTLVSGLLTHSYGLARPSGAAGKLPLVIALHGDGGTGASFRAGLRLEDALRGRAIVAYIDAIGGTFEYYTKAGRDSEAAVVTQLIADLNASGIIRTDRVFLIGFSGGATMVNAIGFRLGPAVLRGLGIMSGSLYSIGGDLPAQIPGNPSLPPALIIWGQADNSGGTEYAGAGIPTRNAYLAAYQVVAAPQNTQPSPTVIYTGNPANIWWCAVPGMGHAIYEKAPEALWAWFSSRL